MRKKPRLFSEDFPKAKYWDLGEATQQCQKVCYLSLTEFLLLIPGRQQGQLCLSRYHVLWELQVAHAELREGV